MGRRIILAELAARAWPKFLRTGVFASGTRLMSNTWLPFDSGKTYKVTAKLRRGTSADGSCYVGVLLRRADGSFITGDQAGMFIVAPSGAGHTPGTSWATITRTFGSGTGRSFPADAVSMAPFFIVGHGQTVAHHDIRECWIEDTAAAGVPISDDPYLLDLARWVPMQPNYHIQTETFDNAAWSKTATTVSAGSTTDPYGGTAADKLIDTVATPASPYFYMSRSVTTSGTAGTDFTLSVYAKAAELGFANLRVDDGSTNVSTVSFNLTTGAVGTIASTGNHQAAGAAAGAVNVGSGWWRIWLSVRFGVAPTSVSSKIRLSKGIGTSASDLGWTGTGAQGVHFFGAQLERRLGMGPYMPVVAVASWTITGDPSYSHLTLVGSEAVSTTLRFGTSGYVSKPSDTPASATYAGRIVQPGLIRCDLPAEGFGATSMQYGEIVLANGDGALSELPYFGLDGQTATIKWGDEDAALSSFTTIAVATMEQATVDAKTARIRMRSLDALLNRQHIAARYGGTGALDGSAELAGRVKPVCYGRTEQVEPMLVDPTRNIYQINSTGDTTTLANVRIAGVAQTAGSVYTSSSDLLNNAPSAGAYRYWDGGATGAFFRLGTTPTGVVTCDVSVGYGAFANPWKAIYDAAIDAGLTSAEMFKARSDTIDLPDNDQYPDHRYPGVWFADERTTWDVVGELARQVGAWVGFAPDGIAGVPKLTFDYWPGKASALTANDEAARLFDDSMILDATAIADPGPGRGVPVWSVEVRVGVKSRLLSRQEASSLTLSDYSSTVGYPYYSYISSDATIKDKHQTARAIVHSADGVFPDNPQYISARLLEVWRHPRLWFDVRLPLDAVLHPVRTFRPRLGGYVFLRWPQLRYLKNDGVARNEGWFYITSIETDLARGEVRLRVRQAVEDVI